MRQVDEVVWPGGEHRFRLGIGELRAIEQRSDAGCAVVLMRLLSQSWKIDDVIGPIRLGLIGGGMPEKDAQKTVDAALEVASPYALAVTAADIIRRSIMWDGGDQPGEAGAGAGSQTQTRFPTDEAGGLATTVQAPS